MAIKSANWFMDSSYYNNYKDYERIYKEYKDFFKKYGIDINSVRELGWNPMIFEVLKRHYDYNHNRPKQADLDVSKLVSPPSINSILGGVLTAPKSGTPLVTPPMALPEQEKEVLPIAVNPNGGMPALPISGMYNESAVSTDTNEPSGKVVVGPDTEVNPSTSVPAAEGNTMKVYDTKTDTTNTYDPSTGELVSTSNVKQIPSVNSVVKGASTPRTPQARIPVTVTTPAPINKPVMPAPNKMSLASAYKRDLWNLINSKGISSPAEAVQRGIIPAEYLNLF